MNRTKIYSFCNCIYTKQKYLSGVSGNSENLGLFTRGINQLLSGESFRLDQSNTKLLKEYNIHRPVYSKKHNPIHQEEVFGIAWSPFADCILSITDLNTEDDEIFPRAISSYAIIPGATRKKFSLDEVIPDWNKFIALTNNIPKKAVVLYNTNRLIDEGWTKKIEEFNEKAITMFTKSGWEIFKIEDNIDGPEY